MKKLFAISLFSCFLLAGCATTHAVAMSDTSNTSSTSMSVQEVAHTGLGEWNISMTPDLSVDAEYVGSVTCTDPTLQTDTGITVHVNSLKPHDHIKLGPVHNNTHFLGQVIINLSWTQNGKKMTGQATFQIS